MFGKGREEKVQKKRRKGMRRDGKGRKRIGIKE